MSKEAMEFPKEVVEAVLRQSPDWATEMQIRSILAEKEGDVVATLAKIWNIESPRKKEATRWEEIREICDAHDLEMEKALKGSQQG